jgi:hypothetical protein
MKAKYLYVLLFLFSFSSCSDDLLYQEPSTSLTDESVLESAENVKAVLMGAYSLTGHYHYLTIGQISLDVMGNDLKISNGNYHYSTYNWLMYSYAYQQYPREFDGWWSAYSPYMWEKAYKAIDECNQIIVNADKLPEGCDDLLAQAYGIRGWNFLNLYHLYCASYTSAGPSGQGLFLRLTPADASGDNAPRSDLATSMKRIIDDFTYVYKNSTGTDSYFINKRAAALLLARTYLDMGEYDNARMYAEAVGSPFDGSDLMTKEEYQSGFNTINSEWLWGFNFTSETTNIYASIPSFYQVATAKDKDSGYGTPSYGTQVDYDYLLKNGVDYLVGYGTVRAAKSFVDIFEDNDCRKLFPFYLDSKERCFTMANAQKYTRAACGHLAAHYERRKDEKGEYVKFGNQDIDPQKTHLNYNLAPRRGVEQIDFIRQRTTEARTLKRDDVNVMCSWVVTLPEYRHHNQNLHVSPDKEQVERLFFERSYRFQEVNNLNSLYL